MQRQIVSSALLVLALSALAGPSPAGGLSSVSVSGGYSASSRAPAAGSAGSALAVFARVHRGIDLGAEIGAYGLGASTPGVVMIPEITFSGERRLVALEAAAVARLMPPTAGPARPYLSAGFGAYAMQDATRGDIRDRMTGAMIDRIDHRTIAWRPGFQIGAGLQLAGSTWPVALVLDARAHVTTFRPARGDQPDDFYTLGAGLEFPPGR